MIFTIVVWVLFLFAWLPWMHLRHKARMRMLAVLNRSLRFQIKYRALKKLSGG